MSPINEFVEKIADEADGSCSEFESGKIDYESRIDHLHRELDLQKSSIVDMVDFRQKYNRIQEQCIIQKEEFQATIEYINEKHDTELMRVKTDMEKEIIDLESQVQTQQDYSERLKEETTLIYENIIQNLSDQLVSQVPLNPKRKIRRSALTQPKKKSARSLTAKFLPRPRS
jgi:hypothetical protein